ncbi:hypothetical protein LCGC14_1079860 [marine sediment metagenome]|uniref:Uncharacterized protein n=1 Tax=marine sediment metagenome TaxID=412755 RepID=A0A0F9MK98_9ZZZZ
MTEFSDLIGANLVVRNDEGKIILAMKRKDTWGPTYYLFEKYEDRVTTEEGRQKLEEAMIGLGILASKFGFPLYDTKEINEGLAAKLMAVMESKEGKAAQEKANEGDEDRVFIKDVLIRVFNHATKDIDELTIGISAASKGSVESLGLGKDVGTDNGQEDNQEAQ